MTLFLEHNQQTLDMRLNIQLLKLQNLSARFFRHFSIGSMNTATYPIEKMDARTGNLSANTMVDYSVVTRHLVGMFAGAKGTSIDVGRKKV